MNKESSLLLNEILTEYKNNSSHDKEKYIEKLLIQYITDINPLSKYIYSYSKDILYSYINKILKFIDDNRNDKVYSEHNKSRFNKSSSKYEDKRIKKIIFHDFRSIPSRGENKGFTVDFINSHKNVPSSVFMVGRNGTGKTTIFDAIEYFYTGCVSSAKLRGFIDDEVKNYLTYGMGQIEGREARLIVNHSDNKETLLDINSYKVDISSSAMFISEYDFYAFQNYNKSIDFFILQQLGYAQVVEFKEMLENLSNHIKEYKQILEPIVDYEYYLSPYFELVVKEIIKNKKSNIDVLILKKIKNKEITKEKFHCIAQKFLGKIKNRVLMFSTEWNKIIGKPEIDNVILDRLYYLYKIFVDSISICEENEDFINTSDKIMVSALNYVYNRRQQVIDYSDVVINNDKTMSYKEKRSHLLNSLIDIINEIKILINEKISLIIRDFSNTYGDIINNVLSRFSVSSETFVHNLSLDSTQFKINVKNTIGEFSTFPQQYFNTFRYKVYIVLLKYCLALEYMRYNKCVLPIVIDDVFLSSDFENIVQLHDLIALMYHEYHKRIYITNDKQVGSNIPMQLIFLTLDEKMICAVEKGVKKFARELNNDVLYPYVVGRLFSYTEHEELLKSYLKKNYIQSFLQKCNIKDRYINLYKAV